jgi:DNA replication protein DnaC
MNQDVIDDMQEILNAANESYREMVASGELQREREAQRRRLFARQVEELSRLASVSQCPPEEAELVIYERLNRTSAMDQMRRAVGHGWAQQERPSPGSKHWVLVSGLTGAGKTLAAVWALLRGTLNAEGSPMRGDRVYVTSEEVAELNAGYGPDKARMRELVGATWLVLDDVGYHDAGSDGYLGNAVQRLLSGRHRWRNRTIVATNLSPAQLREYLEPPSNDETTPRLADRLRQLITPIITTDPSLRGALPAERQNG